MSKSSKVLPLKPKGRRLNRSSNLIQWRLLMIGVLLLVAIITLAVRLYFLQIIDAPTLANQAARQQTIELRPFVPRRPIVDAQGNILALDRPAYTLYAHPKLFTEEPRQVADRLALILQEPAAKLLAKLSQAESGLKIAQGLTEEQGQQIRKLNNNGLELSPNYARIYPQQDLAAAVLGYVNEEHQGQAGLEFSQQKLIQGRSRPILTRQTGRGQVLPDLVDLGELNFDDRRLMLTLDSRIQRAARTALAKAMGQFKAKRGAVVVMDAQDGSLLSLVVEPTFNPNQYYKSAIDRFKNWAVSDPYEPGSTFKPLVVAIALEAQTIQPETIINDSGRINIGEDTIFNSDRSGRGDMTLTDVLAFSSNVGMVKIAQTMPPKTYYEWLKKIGLGSTSGIDLPFETPSTIRSEAEFIKTRIEPATTAFGQGLALTPIQLTRAIASLANGGKLVTPHVIKGLANERNQLEWTATYPEPVQVFRPETARRVLTMMEKTVEYGTGKPAQIPGYRVAGKTGTAQKASSSGGYSQFALVASFVGVIPADQPRYVVLGVVDEPKGNVYGGTAAAPMVREVMEAVLSVKQL